MSEEVVQVTVKDLVTGEEETTRLYPGEYVLTTTEPCYVAGTQVYPAKGTHVITVKDFKARAREDGLANG